MSTVGSTIDFGPAPADPVSDWNRIAGYPTYEQARAAVDYLADADFPVERLDIVGSDVRMVERVTGKLTPWGTAAAGAASGAWFGLFMGLLIGMFTPGPVWLGLIAGGLVIGAIWGAIFGGVGYLAMRGRHEFGSTSRHVAGRYEVVSRGGYAARARTLLQQAGMLAEPAGLVDPTGTDQH